MVESVPALLKQYGISADKKLGQHFLFDQNLTDKIVRSAGPLAGKTVIEVGPGPGVLTRSILAANPERLIVVEKDERFVSFLSECLAPFVGEKLTIHFADALTTALADIAEGPVTIIANLPYNISTPLLMHWIGQIDQIEQMVLMFQKEVVERIVAQKSTKEMGRLAVKSQWSCTCEKLFDVSAKAFYPPPKVVSSIVKMVPRQTPLVDVPAATLDKVARAIFQQRRKKISTSLKQITSDPVTLCQKAGIDPNIRPEALSVEEICGLARFMTV